MSISYGSNPTSVAAQNNVGKVATKLTKSFERLSSGLRVNKAADDPAGMQIADALRTDATLATVAVRNVNDGLSLTSIADASLNEISIILNRMGELAEQSSNDVYTNVQRSAMELEFVALGSEVQRIAETTKFNDSSVLSNSSAVTLQIGIDGSANSRLSIAAVLGTLESLGLANSGQKALNQSLLGATEEAAMSASQIALDAITSASATVSNRRGSLGAAESRLGMVISNLSVARENFIAAESRIRDADVASEVAEMVKLQVLQQASIAILAQANAIPQQALSLLG